MGGALSVLDLLAYDIWANERLFSGMSGLTEAQFIQELGGELSSIRQQAVHLVSVPDRYRARIQGEPVPDVSPESFISLQEVVTHGKEVGERMMALGASLTSEKLTEEIRHETRRGVFVATVEETLFQVINHGTYHRGQIACLLKIHGIEPTDSDFIIWTKYRT